LTRDLVPIPSTSIEVTAIPEAISPVEAAGVTAIPKNEGLPRLLNDNLGCCRWNHRQQRTAQERAYTDKLFHNDPPVSLLPLKVRCACSPTTPGCESACGATNNSAGSGSATATDDTACRSASRRSDCGISGSPGSTAPPAAAVVHDGVARFFDDGAARLFDDCVARLFNDNLGSCRLNHRQQKAAQK